MTGAPPADNAPPAPRTQHKGAPASVKAGALPNGVTTGAGDGPVGARPRKTASPAPTRASKRQRTASQSKPPSQAMVPAAKVAKTASNGHKPELVVAAKNRKSKDDSGDEENGLEETREEVEPVSKRPAMLAPKVRVTPSVTSNGRPRAMAARRDNVTPKAWAWMAEKAGVHEVNFHDVRAVYRLFADPHIPGDEEHHGKKNCRFNPLCYIGLGEQEWLTGPSSLIETDDDDDIEPEFERRKHNVPTGLENLGNTCYMNGTFQMLFHNPQFRNAIYQVDPSLIKRPEDAKDKSQTKDIPSALQKLFSLMEFSNKSYVNPEVFTGQLSINVLEQQDSHEFQKLLFMKLEKVLETQEDEDVKNLVQRLFRGKFGYSTKCQGCKNESSTSSEFYELDLSVEGHSSLKECLDDFTAAEKLAGENKYFCSNCDSKQNATRRLKLDVLPPYLNLQLNRYTYDRVLLRKKKLNVPIEFPDQLDLSSYMNEEEGSVVYQLVGVLVHVGQEAHQGHYIVHVQDVATSEWFSCSDEAVVKIADRRLGTEPDPVTDSKDSKSKKKANGPASKAVKGTKEKGSHSSTNAYGFLYVQSELLAKMRAEEQEACSRKAAVQNKASRRMRRRGKMMRRKRRNEKRNRKMKKQELIDAGVIGEDDEIDTELISEDSEFGELSSFDEDEETSDSEYDSESDEEDAEEDPDFVFFDGIVFRRDFPVNLRAFVKEHRDEFEELVETHNLRKQKQRHNRTILTLRVQEVIERMPYLEDRDPNGMGFEFLPTDWLTSYFENPAATPIIETTKLLCMHGKLDVNDVPNVKIVDSEVAHMLYEEAGLSGRRLTAETLCIDCVKNRWRERKLDEEVARANRMIAELKKKPSKLPQEMYWLGKESFKRWRLMAREALRFEFIEEGEIKAIEEDEELSLLRDVDTDSDEIDDDDDDEEDDDDEDMFGEDEEDEDLYEYEMAVAAGGDGVMGCEEENGEASEKICESVTVNGVRKSNGVMSNGIKTDSEEKKVEVGAKKESEPQVKSSQAKGNQISEKDGIKIKPTNESQSRPECKKITDHEGETKKENGDCSPKTEAELQQEELKEKLAKVGTNVIVAEKKPADPKTTENPKANIVSSGLTIIPNGKEAAKSTIDCSSTSASKRKTNGTVTFAAGSMPKMNGFTKTNGTLTPNGGSSPKFGSALVKSNGPSPPKVLRHHPHNHHHPLRHPRSMRPSYMGAPFTSPMGGYHAHFTRFLDLNHANRRHPCGLNYDILCTHSCLAPSESGRFLVNKEIWDILTRHFTQFHTFKKGAEVCQKCVEAIRRTERNNEAKKEAAKEQKAALLDLACDRNRPSLGKNGPEKVFFVSSRFVKSWKEFLKRPQSLPAITSVSNAMLLCDCEENGLVYDLDSLMEGEPDTMMIPVREDEWEAIEARFDVDYEIVAVRSDGPGSPYITQPTVCEACLVSRLESEEKSRLTYSEEPVYVVRLQASEMETMPDPSDPEYSGTDSPVPGTSTATSNGPTTNGRSSPDAKRAKSTPNGVPNGIVLPPPMRNNKRTQRRKKLKGERRIFVNSSMTLKDFKVQIMNAFQVPPYDQNLYHGGKCLIGTEKTLAEFRILPESTIYLRVDEVNEETAYESLDENYPVNPEEGFKGSGLL